MYTYLYIYIYKERLDSMRLRRKKQCVNITGNCVTGTDEFYFSAIYRSRSSNLYIYN